MAPRGGGARRGGGGARAAAAAAAAVTAARVNKPRRRGRAAAPRPRPSPGRALPWSPVGPRPRRRASPPARRDAAAGRGDRRSQAPAAGLRARPRGTRAAAALVRKSFPARAPQGKRRGRAARGRGGGALGNRARSGRGSAEPGGAAPGLAGRRALVADSRPPRREDGSRAAHLSAGLGPAPVLFRWGRGEPYDLRKRRRGPCWGGLGRAFLGLWVLPPARGPPWPRRPGPAPGGARSREGTGSSAAWHTCTAGAVGGGFRVRAQAGLGEARSGLPPAEAWPRPLLPPSIGWLAEGRPACHTGLTADTSLLGAAVPTAPGLCA